ncbi:alpha/beta hydrolase family protein [Hymenobacter nivis]|uniref:Alpha/beta hydrolase n=1 Tax=Hymenobacter nivis TaxID=1850093 RepID=A0A502GKF8_9BACT|nr:alpha/beta hydrolase [Hymenobacter nivis]TPG62281.1 alpha/beta hydrolase [Hymenobacter nivis]
MFLSLFFDAARQASGLLSRAALLALPFGAYAQSPASLTGDWTGTLGPLTLTAHLTDPAGGPCTATLDVPLQNARGLPLQFTAPTADSVYLRFPQAKAYFAGRRAAASQQLVGEWHQSGQALPLTLARAAAGAPAGPRRPQAPKPPFPYQAADVTFTNAAAGVVLAGTLTTPAGPGPFPAVVLLTGSGPEDRNETLFGHQPFAVLADYLSRRGIAVLRFDDRGVGQSGGSQATSTSADYAADALAALAFVRAQPKIAPAHVGLLGHSEGGTAAIAATSQPQGPNFLVLLAAPGLPGNELIVQQVLALNKLAGATPTQLQSTEKTQRQLLTIVEQTPDDAQARAQLRPLLGAGGAASPGALAQADGKINVLLSPAYRHLLADRPAQTLPHVHCPVLALDGMKDVQVAAAPNLAALAQGLKAGGNRDVTTQALPGLNHLFQTASTGAVSEYGTIEETFAPSALQIIGDWVSAHASR